MIYQTIRFERDGDDLVALLCSCDGSAPKERHFDKRWKKSRYMPDGVSGYWHFPTEIFTPEQALEEFKKVRLEKIEQELQKLLWEKEATLKIDTVINRLPEGHTIKNPTS